MEEQIEMFTPQSKFLTFYPDYWEDLEKLKEILNNKLSKTVKIKKYQKLMIIFMQDLVQKKSL